VAQSARQSSKHNLPSHSYRTNTNKNTRKKMKTASEGRQSCLILPAVSLEGGPLASKGGTVRDLCLTARPGRLPGRVYQKGHASTGSQCARPLAVPGRPPALQGRPPVVPRIHRKKSYLPVFIFIHPRKSLVHLSAAVGVRLKSHIVALWNSNSLDWL
jgi:hypothetical protein